MAIEHFFTNKNVSLWTNFLTKISSHRRLYKECEKPVSTRQNHSSITEAEFGSFSIQNFHFENKAMKKAVKIPRAYLDEKFFPNYMKTICFSIKYLLVSKITSVADIIFKMK